MVKAWTDKKAYRQGDRIRVYIKGNKPFYARVLYKDASGETIQLLPNAHRSENYFNGGAVYDTTTGRGVAGLVKGSMQFEDSLVTCRFNSSFWSVKRWLLALIRMNFFGSCSFRWTFLGRADLNTELNEPMIWFMISPNASQSSGSMMANVRFSEILAGGMPSSMLLKRIASRREKIICI